MRIDRVTGKNVGVIGAAKSGSAAALLLKKYNANVFVSECLDPSSVKDALDLLDKNGIEYEVGGNTEKVFKEKDYVVISPGVPPDSEIVRQIESNGIPIISEIELGYWMCDGHIIAITGSNGKTTTTALTGEILKRSGMTTFIAGNIGSPFCDICDQVPQDGWVVLEVSSFQLERCFEFRPRIAAILNLTPDHLDRYDDFLSYVQMKMRIGENQTENDALVVNYDDLQLVRLSTALPGRKHYFSISEKVSPGIYVEKGELLFNADGDIRKLMDVAEISLPGPHNLANCAASAAMALIANIQDDAICSVLSSFPGIEHRLENCGEIGDVGFVNDSKATNVDSVWYALQSGSGRLVVIMGGRDKEGNFTRLRELVSKRVDAIILLGEASDKIDAALSDVTKMYRASDMDQAVRIAYKHASPDGTVLLSPGCASFDMFRNFEHRGKIFKEAVAALRKETE